jgi:alcohol dehydrogenase (cytochrome c)
MSGGKFGRGRLLAVLAAIAGIALVVALATGAFSSKSGSEVGAQGPGGTATTPTGAGGQSTGAAGRDVPPPFGPDDWGTYGGTYTQTRQSSLTGITKDNVSKLGRVFSVDFRQLDRRVPLGQQSFPIAINGALYVTTGSDFVFAIDARTGKEIWEFVPSNSAIFKNYGVNANRGVAYCDGKLFLATLDMRLISIDPRSGKQIKSVNISEAVPGAKPEFGYSETQAPICYKNLVLIGAAGSDYGVRGFEEAYHTDLTPAWSTPYWTVPPWGTQWRSLIALAGGGTVWNPVAVDPQTDVAYFSVAAPAPQYIPALRPGPDPRTNSVVAVDVFTGRQLWWQQQLAADSWSYGTSQPPMVYQAKVQGRTRKVVSVGTKEGMWFAYDAATGRAIHTSVNLLNHNEHPRLTPGKAVVVYPGSIGGLNYSPSSFDPGTNYIVNSQAETASVLVQGNPADVAKHAVLGDVRLGLQGTEFGYTPPGWHDFGSITAIDADSGAIAWKTVLPEPGRGGVTTTSNGLAFVGGGDGVLRAVDTKTGAVLWQFQTGYQIAAGPSIYEVGGKQYLAITTGGTFTSSFGGTASRLDVFALGGDQTQSPAPVLTPPPLSTTKTFIVQPTQYFGLGKDSRTVTLQAVTDVNGKPLLNGWSGGRQVQVTIPKDWTVDVTFANHDTKSAQGLAIVPLAGAAPAVGGTPAFSGGSTAQPVPPGGVGYFAFRSGKQGSYALASTSPGRAAAGQWIAVKVVGPNEAPTIRIGKDLYTVDVTVGRPSS